MSIQMPDQEDTERGACEVCGEQYDCMSELDSKLAAEWWVDNRSVMAHYECGLSMNWEMA